MKAVQEIMTKNPICCTKDTPLEEASRMMLEHHCGEIPVVDFEGKRPIGVITDRDIVCRTLAHGINPIGRAVESSMSTNVKTIQPGASIEECVKLMEQFQVRRLPVIDDQGNLCGIISQADIARHFSQEKVGELLREVSQPSEAPSRVLAA